VHFSTYEHFKPISVALCVIAVYLIVADVSICGPGGDRGYYMPRLPLVRISHKDIMYG